MKTRILLIRHGQTEWNRKKKYSGSTDIPLNKNGVAQARRLHLIMKRELVDSIYASDLRRALETARIVFRKREISSVKDLREMHFGVFEGLSYKEIIRKHPVTYKRWLDNPYSINIPKGEPLKNFKTRIINCFKKIMKANKGKTVAVICHGGSISIYLNHLLKVREFWRYIPHSASLSVIEYKNNIAKIKLFNDRRHLGKKWGK